MPSDDYDHCDAVLIGELWVCDFCQWTGERKLRMDWPEGCPLSADGDPDEDRRLDEAQRARDMNAVNRRME